MARMHDAQPAVDIDGTAIRREQFACIRARFVEYFRGRGWHRLIGKRIAYEESLLEHTTNTLDVLWTYLELAGPYWKPALSPGGVQSLLIAGIAHDAGKERPEWQQYVTVPGSPYVSDTHMSSIIEVVADLYQIWPTIVDAGLAAAATDSATDASGIRDAIDACRLHMRRERTADNRAASLFGAHSSRWQDIALLVNGADNLVSTRTPQEGARWLRGSVLGKMLHASYHQVTLRGVSTPLLHEAAQEAFQTKGWRPLLFYPTGTLYVAAPVGSSAAPERVEIEAALARLVGKELRSSAASVPELVVGSIVENFLPKPELFREFVLHLGMAPFLQVATGRNKTKKAQQIPEKVGHEVCLRLRGNEPSAEHSAAIREQIGQAYPEIAIFKFFKNALDPSRQIVTGEERQAILRAYEVRFGPGSSVRLMTQSTLMAAKDYLLLIRPFHALPAAVIDPEAAGTIGGLAPARRREWLISTLAELFTRHRRPPAAGAVAPGLAARMAGAFLADLIFPAGESSNREPSSSAPAPVQRAQEQRDHYERSKDRGSDTLCHLCNQPVGAANSVEPLADFYPNPDAFSQRKRAYGSKGVGRICRACHCDRLLGQILLGQRPQEAIVVRPQMSLSREAAEQMRQNVLEMEQRARELSNPESYDPAYRLSALGFTPFSRAPCSLAPEGVRPADLLTAFTFQTGAEKLKEQSRELVARLEQSFATVAALNGIARTDYTGFSQAAAAILEGTAPPELRRDPQIQELLSEACRLIAAPRLPFHTPNLLVIPLAQPFGSDRASDTKIGLYRLLTSLWLAIGLDAAVAVVPADQLLQTLAEPDTGIALVPPLATLRGYFGASWISLAHAPEWCRALLAAAALARRTGYAERNDLVEVLNARSVGYLARRIEQQGYSLNATDLPHLESLERAFQLRAAGCAAVSLSTGDQAHA